MKPKYVLMISLLALILVACGNVQGDEPAFSDDPPAGTDPEPTTDPNQPVTSDDPLPTPTATADPDQTIFGQATVESIEIMILESFPVQVHVLASGFLSDGCTQLGPVNTEFENDTFFVIIETNRPAEGICTQQLVEFQESVPLDVVGLKAGTYTVNVNGVIDSFTLEMDNVLNLPGSEVGNGGNASALPEADQAELIRLTLERALVAQEIPDYQLLTESGDIIILSTENIDPALAPTLPGIELTLLTPDEVQTRANQEGDFPHLRFQQFDVLSETEVTVSLASNWARAEDSDTFYLSGGGFTIEFVRGAAGWTGEIVAAWIS